MQNQPISTSDTLNFTQILNAYVYNMGSSNNAQNSDVRLNSFIENISSRTDSPTQKTSKLDKLKTALIQIKTHNASWEKKRTNKFEPDSTTDSIKKEIKKSLKIYQEYFLTKFSSDGNPDNCDSDIKDRLSNFNDGSELLISIDASTDKDSLVTLGIFLNTFLLGLTIASESTISEDKKSTNQSEEIDKIKTNLLAFPGGTSFDEKIVYACINGTIARVMDGISALNDSSIELRFAKEYFDASTAILAQKVRTGSQVHTQSCLIGALMIERNKIAEIDNHFTSPQSDIALSDIIKFSHGFTREIENKLSLLRGELIEEYKKLSDYNSLPQFLEKAKFLGLKIDPLSLTKEDDLTLISVDEFTERHLKFPTEKFKKELSKVPEALTSQFKALDYLEHLLDPNHLFKIDITKSGDELVTNRIDVKKITNLVDLLFSKKPADEEQKSKLLAGLVTLRTILDGYKTGDNGFLFFLKFDKEFTKKTGSDFKSFFFEERHGNLVVKDKFKQEKPILETIISRYSFLETSFLGNPSDESSSSLRLLAKELVLLENFEPGQKDRANLIKLISKRENINIKNGSKENLLNILYQFDKEAFKLAIEENPQLLVQIGEKNNDGLSLINILAQKGDNELLLYVLDEYKSKSRFREFISDSKPLIKLINNQKLLFDIVKTNNLEILQKVIAMAGNDTFSEVKLDFNKQDPSGATILHLACKEGYLDIAKDLIERYGVNLNLDNTDKTTPLYEACQNGHTEIVKALIEKDRINLKPVQKNKATPLFIACQNGHTQIVKALIAKDEIGLNQAKEEGITPLYVACFQGHLDIVKALIAEEKIDLNLAKEDGKTPLYVACSQGKVDIVKALIKKKEIDLDLSAKDETSPLLIACQKGHCEIVEALFNAGANIDLLKKRNCEKAVFNCVRLSLCIPETSDENSFTPKMNELIERITSPDSIRTRDENLKQITGNPNQAITGSTNIVFSSQLPINLSMT